MIVSHAKKNPRDDRPRKHSINGGVMSAAKIVTQPSGHASKLLTQESPNCGQVSEATTYVYVSLFLLCNV